MRRTVVVAVAAVAAVACAGETVDERGLILFPDVVAAEAIPEGGGAYRFEVTLSSPYDSPERHADAWRVVGPDGEVYGVRELLHDHAGEQPFTRSLSGVEIPDGVARVTVEGRDEVHGWGGATVTVALPAARSRPLPGGRGAGSETTVSRRRLRRGGRRSPPRSCRARSP